LIDGSGLGGATVAGRPLGWSAALFSEIPLVAPLFGGCGDTDSEVDVLISAAEEKIGILRRTKATSQERTV